MHARFQSVVTAIDTLPTSAPPAPGSRSVASTASVRPEFVSRMRELMGTRLTPSTLPLASSQSCRARLSSSSGPVCSSCITRS